MTDAELTDQISAAYRIAETAREQFHGSPNFVPYHAVLEDLQQHREIPEIDRLVALWETWLPLKREWERRFPAPEGAWWGCDRQGIPKLFRRSRIDGYIEPIVD